MDDFEERVRRRAYQIWLEEGRPEGRYSIHWEMARELCAIEDNQKSTTKRVHRHPSDPTIAADTVEPSEPAASMGELPTMTDEGEQSYPPSRDAEARQAEDTFPSGTKGGRKAAKPKAPAAGARKRRPRTPPKKS